MHAIVSTISTIHYAALKSGTTKMNSIRKQREKLKLPALWGETSKFNFWTLCEGLRRPELSHYFYHQNKQHETTLKSSNLYKCNPTCPTSDKSPQP